MAFPVAAATLAVFQLLEVSVALLRRHQEGAITDEEFIIQAAQLRANLFEISDRINKNPRPSHSEDNQSRTS